MHPTFEEAPSSDVSLAASVESSPELLGGPALDTAPPSSSASLVGRALELSTLDTWLDEGWLVTLVGPAGIGKTRIAARFVARWLECGGDAWLCEAEASSSTGDLCGALVRTLDLGVDPQDEFALVERAAEWLSERTAPLLVIDGFDHLEEGAIGVLESLRRFAPGLRLVVTARHATGAADEQPLEVGPLPLEDAEDLLCRTAALTSLREADAVHVRRIAHRLGGNPLAIELVAARLGPTTLEHVSNELAEYAGEREKEEEALFFAIEWSYRQLASWQASALVRLAAFAGPFELATVDAIFAEARRRTGEAEATRTLDAMHALMRSRFVRVIGRAHFTLFDAVKRTILEGAEPAAREEAFALHAAHFTARAHAAAQALEERGDMTAVKSLAPWRDDLRAVLARAVSSTGAVSERAASAAAVMGVLGPLMLVREAASSQIPMLEDALALVRQAGEIRTEARLSTQLGLVFRRSGRFGEALGVLEQARAVARQAACTRAEAFAVLESAHVLVAMGQAEAARARADVAVTVAEAAEDRRLYGLALSLRAQAHADRGAFAEARADGELALMLLTELDAPREEAAAHTALGITCIESGALADARGHFERAASFFAVSGDLREEAVARGYLGGILHEQEDLAAARHAYQRAHATFRMLGDRRLEAIYLGYLGIVDLQLGRMSAAFAALDEARTRLERMGDARFETVMAAALTGARALTGDAAGAAVGLVAVERAANRLGASNLVRLVEVYRGVIEAARGDVGAARRRAEELARVRAEDVRLALPLLHRVIRESEGRAQAWLFEPSGVSFRPPGRDSVELSAKSPLSRLLAALVAAHVARRGSTVSRDELSRAAWPDEPRLIADVARNRIKVAMSTLRKMGLGVLVTSPGGYMLDPEAPIAVSTELPS